MNNNNDKKIDHSHSSPSSLRRSRGFTLVELMVVVAIIAMLSSVTTTGYQIARARGRDAKRFNDIRTIRTAIEFYRNDFKGVAPQTLNDLITSGALAVIPEDPFNSGYYTYQYRPGGAAPPESLSYSLRFTTESDTAVGPLGIYCATSKRIYQSTDGVCIPE